MPEMPMIPFENPEAARQFLEQQQQQLAMTHRDMVHRVSDVIEALSEEQLQTLDRIILTSSDHDHYAGYIRGQIDMVLETKFKVCRCGVNHEAELEQEFAEQRAEDAPQDRVEDDHDLMIRYNVEPVPNKVAEQYPTQYRCSNCLVPISSLEDRMIKPPGIDGCSGCQRHSATGEKWFGG